MEVRSVAEKQAGNQDRRRRCTKCRDGDAGIEPSYQLFEDEDSAGNRCIEGGGEPSTCTGREQHSPVRPAAAKNPSYDIGYRCSHLHNRALAAEREPSADRQQPTKELHRDQLWRRRRQLAVQHGLDMWNAASRSRGREAADEPRRQGDGSGTRGDNQ